MGGEPETLVEMRGVSRHVTMGQERLTVLRDVDLVVRRGETLAIVGASGSGKSSALELIGTLSRPSEGRILWAGSEMARMSQARILSLRRRHIGFVFQGAHLIDHLTAAANVSLPLAYAGVPRRDRATRAARWLTRTGVGHLASRSVARLSGGERQRVAIARALVTEPDLILADEPTGNLDQETGQEIMALLVGLAEGQRALVVVTHDVVHMKRFDRVVRMDMGRLSG